MKRFLEYLMLLLVLLTVSCSSETYIPEEDSAENYICFMAFTETMTKGEIDAVSDIENLYVTETLNNTFKNEQLQLQQNGICRTNEPWTSGAYSFFGYAQSNGRGSIYPITDNGRSFAITQPQSGSGDVPSSDGSNSDFADYLLSYTNYVEDGSSRPLVTLQLVHAVSSVELHFVKPAGASETIVESASVNGVHYSASYSVNDHTADNISWTCSRSEEATTNYSRETTDFKVPEMADGNTYFPDGSLYFSFLTVQQPVDNITIDVSFSVAGTEHTASFSLDSVTGVSNWMAGTKTRYSIVLDTEVRISGSITQWNDGGEMEGTLVP